MKKRTLLTIVVAAGLASCTTSVPKANLKTELDTLSYSVGLANTRGLKDYLFNQMDLDSTYFDDFIKGVNEGANKSGKKDAAYLAGLQIGHQISSQMVDGINKQFFGESGQGINKEQFLAGFNAGLLDKGVITQDEAELIAKEGFDKLQEKQMLEEFGENKAEGEKFLAENKAKEGVVTTESGLQYEILREGKGAIPTDENTVKVHYEGKLLDGTIFDSSYEREEPAEFPVTGVIKGWTEALKLMPVGSKWKVYIPQELAYGKANTGKINPFSMLIFEVELLDITK